MSRRAPSSTQVKEHHVPHFNIKINGSQAPKKVMDDLLECSVENSLHLPDLCTLRMHDQGFTWLDSSLFQEGTRLQVFGGEGKSDLKPLFDGEITGIEMDLAGDGVSTITVNAMDRSHRLHRGREVRTFVNMKDSDIIAKIGQELGFKVTAESTKKVHDWVIQNNQTSWEFMTQRAQLNGFRLFVKNEKDLHFEKVKHGGEGVIELEWGKELRSFRPRTATSRQVSEVVVRSWDPNGKRPIVGKAKEPKSIPQTGRPAKGGDIAKRAFGEAKWVVVDRPVHSDVEAEDLAQSICDEIAGSFLEADGLCFAVPDLKPGKTVHIKNIGKRFSGEYHVTSTTHTYTPTEGYATQFVISGKQSNNLVSMLGGGSGQGAASRSQVGGNIVIGLVTDNKDPEGLGRVKVKYPWLNEGHQSFWARQATQMGGAGRGMFNIPEINDEVLVAFEHGDVSRPFVIGQLWNGKDKVPSASGNPVHGPGSVVNRRGFHTRIGHQLNFDDTGGKGGIHLKSSNNHNIHIDDANKKIEATTTNGHLLVLDDQNKKVDVKTTGGHQITADDQGKSVTLKTTSGHTIVMSDAGNNISITDNAGDNITMVMGAITITALLAVNITAPMIGLHAPVMLTGEGAVVNFNAGVKGRFTSRGTVTIDSSKEMNVKSGDAINAEATKDIKIKTPANVDIEGKKAINLNS